MTVEIDEDDLESAGDDAEETEEEEQFDAAGDPLEPLDLDGIPKILHELLRASEKEDRALTEERDLPAARRVHCNKDGTVGIKLVVPIKARNGDDVDGIRLRPLKALDYFNGATERLAEARDLTSTLQFAHTFAVPKGIVGELACTEDMNAVYYGVMAARGNFSRRRT